MKKKSPVPWILLLVLPIPLLIANALVQLIIRAVLVDAGEVSVIQSVVNIVSILIGLFAVSAILGAPIWIIMLVKAGNYNKSLEQQPQASPAPQPPADPQVPPANPSV